MIKKIHTFNTRWKLLMLTASLVVLVGVTILAGKYSNYPNDIYEIKFVNNAPEIIKIPPEDRGGLQFQNQDKNVFDILDE